MWDIMNGMANGMRRRMMPRRRNGMNTMTAMILGASVGIAAWETVRRTRPLVGDDLNATHMAEQVLESMDK